MLRSERLTGFIGRRWPLLFFSVELVFFSCFAGGFFTPNGARIVLFYSTTLALLATAETFVIVTGGIDLSVGFVMGFASVVSARLAARLSEMGISAGPALVFAILFTLAIGLIPGFVNGILVARLKVPPFLATFSVQGITYGISLLVSAGSAEVNVPSLASMIGNGSFLYIVPDQGPSFFVRPPLPPGTPIYETISTMVLVTLFSVAVAAFLLARTRFGRHTYAIGGNVDAAIRSGIHVEKHLVVVYMISSFLASLAGVIYMMEYVTGKSDAGSSFLLDSVVAVVIGGASLFGGTGTVWRTLLGVLILSVLEMGLKMMGVQTFDKYIAVGIILIFAVLVDQYFPELVETED